MPSQRTLILASIAFSVLWTAGMISLSWPMPTPVIIVPVISGVLAGIFWFTAMRVVMLRLTRSRLVSRLRSSPTLAANSDANFAIKGH